MISAYTIHIDGSLSSLQLYLGRGIMSENIKGFLKAPVCNKIAYVAFFRKGDSSCADKYKAQSELHRFQTRNVVMISWAKKDPSCIEKPDSRYLLVY
jgi:hypothetical protein